MSRTKNELLEVVLESADCIVAWIAHDPYASYSRSVGPFAARNIATIAAAGGAEFLARVRERGIIRDQLRHDRPYLDDGRAVTGYVFEVAQ